MNHPPDHRVRPAAVTPGFVAANIRGVMLAAYLPLETIMWIFGCSADEALRFSCGARDDLAMTKAAIGRAKERMSPTR